MMKIGMMNGMMNWIMIGMMHGKTIVNYFQIVIAMNYKMIGVEVMNFC